MMKPFSIDLISGATAVIIAGIEAVQDHVLLVKILVSSVEKKENIAQLFVGVKTSSLSPHSITATSSASGADFRNQSIRSTMRFRNCSISPFFSRIDRGSSNDSFNQFAVFLLLQF
jgi:hypothetical protein